MVQRNGYLPIFLLAAACNSTVSTLQTPTSQNTAQNNPTPANTQTIVAQPISIFENQYMKITVPTGWRLTEATQTIQNKNYDKNTGKITLIGPPVVQKTGAVNIIKGNYILYINPHAQQVSGIVGGRFGEISGGAPSSDAVNIAPFDFPASCGISESTQKTHGSSKYFRVDLYVSVKDKTDYCKVPTNGKTVWYFSYFTADGGYFNYNPGGITSLVSTIAYNSNDPNKFPIKGSAELNAALDEMTIIVSSIQVK